MKLTWTESTENGITHFEAETDNVATTIDVMPDGKHIIAFAIDGAKTINKDKWLAEKVTKLIEEAIG